MTQFVSPDDEHDVIETCRVKNINKYIEKNCASRWSFTTNHYMMHGQQNIKCYRLDGKLIISSGKMSILVFAITCSLDVVDVNWIYFYKFMYDEPLWGT